MSVCLLVIDPQVDFMPGGALGVPGADKDMKRLSAMVSKYGGDIDDIQITMDSHYHIHIAHQSFWLSVDRTPPDIYTTITVDDMEKEIWRPKNPEWKDWALYYVKQLKENDRYQLMIWPDHCIIGSPGQCIEPTLLEAVSGWEGKYDAIAPRTTKGSNPFTEHFSVIQADVPHPKDASTRLNGKFVDVLKEYDDILTGGEALSHCLANSVRDTADQFSEDQIKKFVLLEDASSNVANCESLGDSFVNDMVNKGMRVSLTTKFF